MRTSKILLILVVTSSLFITSGCSQFEKSPYEDTLKYLSADAEQRIPTQEFEKVLSREVYLAGGNYHIVAFPYTLAYLSALIKENSVAEKLSKTEKAKALKRLINKYIAGKTCFKFRYAVLRFNEVGQLKDWQVTYFNNSGKEVELAWEANPKRDPSFAESSNPLEEIHDKWLGDGVACASTKLNLTESFGLKVRPQYVQFPFDSYGDLYWDLNNAAQPPRHRKTNL